MHKYNVLFSFAAVALTMGAVGGVFALDNTKANADIRREPATVVPSVPPMELPTVIELPDTAPLAAKVEAPKVKVASNTKPKRTITFGVVMAEHPKEKQMVCGDWYESNYGGRVRNCEMK